MDYGDVAFFVTFPQRERRSLFVKPTGMGKIVQISTICPGSRAAGRDFLLDPIPPTHLSELPPRPPQTTYDVAVCSNRNLSLPGAVDEAIPNALPAYVYQGRNELGNL